MVRVLCVLVRHISGFESYCKQKLDIKVENGGGMNPLSIEFQNRAWLRRFLGYKEGISCFTVLQLAY